MSRAKWAVILLPAFILVGCYPDRAKDLAACRLQADHFFQAYRAVDPEDPSSRYIIGCMETKGYRFTVTRRDCDSRHPLPTQPACYEPNSWGGQLIAFFKP